MIRVTKVRAKEPASRRISLSVIHRALRVDGFALVIQAPKDLIRTGRDIADTWYRIADPPLEAVRRCFHTLRNP